MISLSKAGCFLGVSVRSVLFGSVMLCLAGQGNGQMAFPGGRIALSHDGNNYDKDDYVAAAMNLALLEATGLKAKLVHFDHSCHLVNKPDQHREMLESVNGGIRRFGIDPSRVFDVQDRLDEAIANFKKEAEKSSASDPLWFCIAGPMEVPYRCIEAVAPEKRRFIHCVSHSDWNNTHAKGPGMRRTWKDVRALGVEWHGIRNQNKTGWNTEVGNVLWMRDSENPDLRWLFGRNAKATYDSSDSGMLWWVMTGAEDGGDEEGGWRDYRPLLESLSGGVAEGEDEEGFVRVFNGRDFDGWYLKVRGGDGELAEEVFAIEDGMVHVFGGRFPEEFERDTGENATHGMMYFRKEFSRYILRFDYKWGRRKANNFDKWQYDAGVYYHVTDDRIWPTGIEYQIRYDHTRDRNHTGDLIRPEGTDYKWFGGADGTYLHPRDGGRPEAGDGWMHLAMPTENHHGLDGKWNACEIIVMGGIYAVHKLNGEVVNMAVDLKPASGIFGFQAETAEIFYRNIRVKELEGFVPAEEFLE